MISSSDPSISSSFSFLLDHGGLWGKTYSGFWRLIYLFYVYKETFGKIVYFCNGFKTVFSVMVFDIYGFNLTLLLPLFISL